MVLTHLAVLVIFPCTILSGTIESACSASNPCHFGAKSEPVVRCEELISTNGHLDVVLTVEIGMFRFDWLEIRRRSYNKTLCPPTWRIKPGDTVNVTLINMLKDISGNDREQEVTNLHTHGLHISPLEPQDNVFISVAPGESYKYTYKIAEDQSPGTYWYHPHHHRSTTLQTVGGMAGMIIVEDDPAKMSPELNAVSCPEHCEYDIPLIISPMLMMKSVMYEEKVRKQEPSYPEGLGGWLSTNVNEFAVNGALSPIVRLKRNKIARLRLLHVGYVAPLELEFAVASGESGKAPCEVREIARDGVYFDHPLVPRLGQSVLYPGNRLDVLVRCHRDGFFTIISNPKEQHRESFAGSIRKTKVIAVVEVLGSGDETGRQEFPKTLPPRPRHMADLRNVVADQYITVEIGGNNTLNRELWSSSTNYRYKVEVDSVVEIQMLSADNSFSHPIHFHINHVQIIGYQPYTGPVAHYKLRKPMWEMRDAQGDLCYYQHPNYIKGVASKHFNITDPLKYQGHYERWINNGTNSLAYNQAGQWVDTLHSPALSNITLRMKTDKFMGPLVLHCHMPSDSDGGMMMVIEIVEKGAYLGDANVLSGGAPPGSCRKCDWNRFVEMPPECTPDVGKESSKIPDAMMNLLITLLMTLQHANEMANEELLD